MKKISIIAVLLLTVSFTYAQLNLGVKVGYNSSLGINDLGSVTSGTYNLNSVKSDVANGFEVGGFARIGFQAVYLQPELVYAFGKKNYTETFQDNSSFDKHVTISTIDVPVLLGYKLLDLKLLNLRVFAGPRLRFNAGSTLNYNNIVGGGFNAANLQQDVKAAQLGLVGGVGVDVLMLTLDLRYNLIKDMYQTKLNNINIDNVQGNTLEISLGWKFF